MKRLLSYQFNDAIQVAEASIPPKIMARLAGVDYCCGVDPVFVGLHRYTEAKDGRPYSATAHVAWTMHQKHLPLANRVPTVVLPVEVEPETVAHELGHALHEQLDFGLRAAPVTAYAQTNRWEAFAEAFTAWLGWYGEDFRAAVDEKTRALFHRLAMGN
jgi:hypothetical protein